MRDIVVPWFRFVGIVIVKRLVVGKFKPGPRDVTGGWDSLRYWLMDELLTDGV